MPFACPYEVMKIKMDEDKIIETIDKLYEKYKVDKSFYNEMSKQEKIRGMKGILAELEVFCRKILIIRTV